jgi:hypothetical protein
MTAAQKKKTGDRPPLYAKGAEERARKRAAKKAANSAAYRKANAEARKKAKPKSAKKVAEQISPMEEISTQPPAPKPTEYTPELGEQVCQLIERGSILHDFDQLPGLPDAWHVLHWRRTVPEFRERYELARLTSAEMLESEAQRVANDGINDTYIDEKSGRRRTDWDVVARSKLRIDTLRWSAKVRAPKIYGESVKLSNDPDAPFEGAALAPAFDPSKLKDLSPAELDAAIDIAEKLGGQRA